MDYEQKYKEALEKLQEALAPTEDGCKISGLTRGCIENIFPELKEPEDEEIREWCISHFKSCINVIKDNDEYKEYLNNKVIPWLEKQGHMLDPDKVIEWLKTKVNGSSTYGIAMIEQFKKDFGL